MNVHTCVHTHTHTGLGFYHLQRLWVLISHTVSQIIHVHVCAHMCTHTCTHTHTCIHTDWACTTCSDFGLMGSYFSHFIHKARAHLALLCKKPVHHIRHKYTRTCTQHTHTHTHAQTQTGIVLLAVTLGSYFSHCLYKAYMCMNVHTCVRLYHLQRLWVLISHTVSQIVHVHVCTHMCTHTCTHTHKHTQTGLVPLAVTLGSYFSHFIHKARTCVTTHLALLCK